MELTTEMEPCSYPQYKVIQPQRGENHEIQFIITDVCLPLFVIADNRLYLYESSGANFEEYKSVLGRDIGWSILDVVFR